MPPIPAIPEECHAAVVALAQAANVMRMALHLAAAGSDAEDVLDRHGERIALAGVVIAAWRASLGLDLEGEVAGTA